MREDEDRVGQVDLRIVVGISADEARLLPLEGDAFAVEYVEGLSAGAGENHVFQAPLAAGELREGDQKWVRLWTSTVLPPFSLACWT